MNEIQLSKVKKLIEVLELYGFQLVDMKNSTLDNILGIEFDYLLEKFEEAGIEVVE